MNKVYKTKEYAVFIIRRDNREIDLPHLNRIKASIKEKNMLEDKPILVNEDMEILDGQHRYMAAKEMGLDIYYMIRERIDPKDMIRLNNAKAWGIGDYLNYYIEHGYAEYKKLHQFMKSNGIGLRVALSICMGRSLNQHEKYRNGEFVFSIEAHENEYEIVNRSIDYIKKMNGVGNSQYTKSSKFWVAMLKLVKHHNFDDKKWFFNLERMVDKVRACAKTDDYLRLFMEIYNWRNISNKVDLLEEVA